MAEEPTVEQEVVVVTHETLFTEDYQGSVRLFFMSDGTVRWKALHDDK